MIRDDFISLSQASTAADCVGIKQFAKNINEKITANKKAMDFR